ncbi:unnamed protein product [Candida verbasci]|uniref:Thioredoxin-like protein n=1 Tax=Candida verbasci TaxID=1227364 RepID=A0A9W4TSU8_9ASCO|nr:unnamed protein product [Candida verbasci]
MSIQFVKSTTDFNNYIKNNKYLVANFTASWCGPCQAIKPIVDKLYDNFKNVEIVRVDLDSQRDLATKFTVTAVLTFIFIKNGTETDRLKGANVDQLHHKIEEYNTQAQNEGISRKGSSQVANYSSNAYLKDIKSYISKGFDILNSNIEYSSFELLNGLNIYKDATYKDLFNLDSNEKGTIISDSDSQLLIFIPFLNISKIYSILIKLNKQVKKDNLKIDQEDVDELQLPNLCKLWSNRSVLSFEEASEDNNSPHLEKIEGSDGSWYEVKLKYVKFQNVQNLTLFFDSEDEDSHTIIEKIIIVGVNGESKDQGSLPKLEDE